MTDQPVIFGCGSSDYEKYIRTQELFKLQKPPAEWANEEELLFQVIHQAMELWLKVVIQHVEQSVRWMQGGELREASRFVRRSAAILRWLAESLQFPASMAPWDYHKIRMGLGKGSGQESPTYNRLGEITPNLLEAFEAVLKTQGATLDEIHQNPRGKRDLYELTYAMAEFDQELLHWKFRHFQLVRRIIGDAVMSLKGVPASALEKTTHQPAFPDIWAVVNRTTNAWNARYRPEGGGYIAAR